jgi:hypothetical protein
MPRKSPYPILLTIEEKTRLESIARKYTMATLSRTSRCLFRLDKNYIVCY